MIQKQISKNRHYLRVTLMNKEWNVKKRRTIMFAEWTFWQVKSGAVKTFWESSCAPKNQSLDSLSRGSEPDRKLFANGVSEDRDFLFVVHKVRFEEHVKKETGVNGDIENSIARGYVCTTSEFLLPRVPGSPRKLYVYVYVGVFVPSRLSNSLSLSLSLSPCARTSSSPEDLAISVKCNFAKRLKQRALRMPLGRNNRAPLRKRLTRPPVAA